MPPRDMTETDILKGLATLIRGYGEKHDASGTPVTTGFAHGAGGLLSYPGVHPDVHHTIVGPLPGIIDQIPWTPSVYTHETFQILTGVQAGSGAEKEGVCDDPPIGGLLKGAKLWAPFGRYERASPELEINALGERTNSADPDYLRLVGSPLPGARRFMPMALTSNVLQNEIAKRQFELAVAIHRQLAVQVWTGNPTNNTGGGGYKEMMGLALLINTGQVDALTGTFMPALDSDVKAHGFTRIDTAAGQTKLIDEITYIVHTRKDLAMRTRVEPVEWVFVMRPGVFYEITKFWPCIYLTNSCNVGSVTNASLNLDAGDVVGMRDDMRQGRYLLIDGERFPVVLDDGITELSNTTSASVTSGCFASDIYFLPLTILGGSPVIYGEYFDYNNPSIASALAMDPGVRTNGPFLQQMARKMWCIKWSWKIEPRIIVRTPWLAGRITNVQYCPLQHTREPFPSSPYWIDGGVTTSPAPSLYSLF